jgi:hypothetical protein
MFLGHRNGVALRLGQRNIPLITVGKRTTPLTAKNDVKYTSQIKDIPQTHLSEYAPIGLKHKGLKKSGLTK